MKDFKRPQQAYAISIIQIGAEHVRIQDVRTNFEFLMYLTVRYTDFLCWTPHTVSNDAKCYTKTHGNLQNYEPVVVKPKKYFFWLRLRGAANTNCGSGWF
jgi:hypothetical protein